MNVKHWRKLREMLLIKELGSEKSIGNVKTEDEEKDRALTKLEGKT